MDPNTLRGGDAYKEDALAQSLDTSHGGHRAALSQLGSRPYSPAAAVMPHFPSEMPTQGHGVGDGGDLIGVGLTRNELKEGARNLRYSCLSQTYRDTSCDAIHRQTDTQR